MDECAIPISSEKEAAQGEAAMVDYLSVEIETEVYALYKPMGSVFQKRVLTIPLAAEDLSGSTRMISTPPRSPRRRFWRQLR